MRKVFLDELPRKGGKSDRIDWKKSVGCKIPFIYDDIQGAMEIINYNVKSKKLSVEYGEGIKGEITKDGLYWCRLGNILGRITKDFKIEIGQTLKDEKRDLIIVDREYRYKDFIDKEGYNCTQNLKWYKYKCNICGWTEGWIIEGAIMSGNGCSCCSGKTAVLGINTVWDTDRWMVDLGVSEEDAKKYTKSSAKKIEVTCPDCCHSKTVSIDKMYNRKSIACACGDGVSYPEKFIYHLLNQLGLKINIQLSKTTFDWCGKYKYDFYLPDYNIIIETHGKQHYEKRSNSSNFPRTLEEEQENDRIKKELALNNKIEEYIVLDCRRSELEWVRKSVLNSKLNELFDLSKIDWLECEKFALSNLVKEVCEYWNQKEEWETANTIAENNPWGISTKGAVSRYLKKGAKLGWCNYNSKEEMMKSSRKLNKTGKQVEIFRDEKSLGVFKTCAELSRQSDKLFGIKLLREGITKVCRREAMDYKGFTFKYVDE